DRHAWRRSPPSDANTPTSVPAVQRREELVHEVPTEEMERHDEHDHDAADDEPYGFPGHGAERSRGPLNARWMARSSAVQPRMGYKRAVRVLVVEDEALIA